MFQTPARACLTSSPHRTAEQGTSGRGASERLAPCGSSKGGAGPQGADPGAQTQLPPTKLPSCALAPVAPWLPLAPRPTPPPRPPVCRVSSHRDCKLAQKSYFFLCGLSLLCLSDHRHSMTQGRTATTDAEIGGARAPPGTGPPLCCPSEPPWAGFPALQEIRVLPTDPCEVRVPVVLGSTWRNRGSPEASLSQTSLADEAGWQEGRGRRGMGRKG